MEARIQELEIRYTLQQDLLRELNDIIARHSHELARLRAEVDELRVPKGAEPLPFDADERPPHY